VGYFRVIF